MLRFSYAVNVKTRDTLMAELYVGIDVGNTGGIAVLDEAGAIITMARFDNSLCSDVIRNVVGDLGHATLAVAIEAVSARPDQNIVSMFTFGVNYGRIQGFLDAHLLGYALYNPQAWQKWLPKASSAKERVKAWTESKFGFEPFIFPKCRVPHQGCMDAVAIAEYHRLIKLQLIAAPEVRAKTKKKPVLRF